MRFTPAEILDALALAPGDHLYVSASMAWLGYDTRATRLLLDALLDRVGPAGTIAMPTFAFRNEVGIPPPGHEFDVRASPSRMGLLSELFRRRPASLRSVNYWLPVSAQGPLAPTLLADQVHLRQPFGPGSVFHRLAEQSFKIIGLGVTTNYVVVTHVADALLGHRYPETFFAPTPLLGVAIDSAGVRHDTTTTYFPQSIRQRTRPSRVIELSPLLRENIIQHTRERAVIFSLPAADFLHEALRLGEAALSRGEMPPWIAPAPT